MTKRPLVLSVAAVAAAIQSLAAIHANQGQFEIERPDPTPDPRVTEALARSQVQMQIRLAMPQITHGLRLNGVLLSERYADLAQIAPLREDSTRAPEDFLPGYGWGCYLNCHGACHGSRSWR